MYLPDPPLPGDPAEAMGFLGLRFRLEYQAHQVQAGAKKPRSSGQNAPGVLPLLGDSPQDLTGVGARWQRQVLSGWQNQMVIPSPPVSVEAKRELLQLLSDPSPPTTTVLYLFCQCTVGDGNDPLLRFGNSANAPDVIKRTELSSRALADRPLVFANACTTSATDPYVANELERGSFSRGCRAYLGTESKVPIQFASRFAVIFFHFFYRLIDPEPVAAGEAMAQTRLFLWTHYRNLGGIFYTYVNQYELFMADDVEVRALRA